MVDPRSELDALLARLRLLPAAEDALAEDFPFDITGRAESRGAEPRGTEPRGTDPRGTDPGGTADAALEDSAMCAPATFAAEEPRDSVEDPREGVEVSAVRTEIEATLHQVLALTRAGQLEPRLHGNVVFVLNALTRPLPTVPRLVDARRAALQREAVREWQLASAAAVLRFCRIVAHLTNGVTFHINP